MVEEAQLITKIKTAFPKEESEHKDIHGTELVAVAVGILLSLAFKIPRSSFLMYHDRNYNPIRKKSSSR